MSGSNDKNPFEYKYVRARIKRRLRQYDGRFQVLQLTNVTNIFYGREVGYAVEQVDDAFVYISGTGVRRKLDRENG